MTRRIAAARTAAVRMFLCLFLLASWVSAAQAAPPPQRLIIKYKNSLPLSARLRGADRGVWATPAARAGVQLARLRALHNGADLLRLSGRQLEGRELSALLTQLAADPNVEYVEEDHLLQLNFVPNDPRYNEQWDFFESVAGVNAPRAWDQATGSGIVVAVVDNGYRPHADLAGQIIPGYDFISDATIANDGNGRDPDPIDPGDGVAAGECGWFSKEQRSTWHGTHVSGTIAARSNNGVGVAGIAFNAKVLMVRALGKCGGYMSDIADAVAWASGGHIDGVPDNANRARVINMSLGGQGMCDRTMQNAINTARGNGAVVVVAAGNSKADASYYNPAGCSGVITVAAVNRSGARAAYSNYGPVVDIAAPGGEKTSVDDPNGILSTLNAGLSAPAEDSYAFYQGTSMATPHVAAVAALALSKNPALSPDRVESLLKRTARPFTASCDQCGFGIVDAAAAVASANANLGGVASCPTGYKQYDGVMSQYVAAYQPGVDGYVAAAGPQSVILIGDNGSNFNLTLEKKYQSPYYSSWIYAASSFTYGNRKELSYNGAAGSYRVHIDAYFGGGAYTLCVKSP